MHRIGIFINTDSITAALFDAKFDKLSEKTSPLATADASEAASSVCAFIDSMLCESSITKESVASVGIANGNTCLDGNSVAEKVQKLTAIPTLAESAIGARALGEAYLAGDKSYLVMISVGEHVDSALVIEKKLFKGSCGSAGVVGHMVINAGGLQCSCGRRGCFDAYASLEGLRYFAKEAGVDGADTISASELFSMSTDTARAAQKSYTDSLAAAITNVINFFQPNEFVLEGVFEEAGDALMNPMMDIVLREQYSRSMSNKANVRFASDPVQSALLGAALLLR